MSERKTVEMGLTKPKEFPTKNGGKGYEFVSIDGEAFSCFDPGFAEAFNSNNLAGVVRPYVYQTSDNPKWKPSLQSIPGLYEGKPQWKQGGVRSGPMFSDAQVALLFASGIDEFEPVAERALAWLKGGAGTPSDGPRKDPAPPIANGNGVGEHLLTLAAEAFGNRPKLAEAWLRSAAKRFGTEIPLLSVDQVSELTTELERKIEDRQT